LEEQIVEEPSSTKALENEVILSKKNEKEIESPFESVTEDALNKLLNEVAENTDSLTDVLESIGTFLYLPKSNFLIPSK
jgi:hypothetical protein